MKKLLWLIFGFSVAQVAFAQESSVFSTNPTYLKWNQINTDHFKVLYPDGFERQAQRVANTLEHIREPEASTMGVRPRKIPIILQNQSAISNGFVALAPRRSEFFAMPTQNYNFSGTNEWMDLLAAHEYRHMVQFQRSITGFNKGLYFLFGQQALAAMAFVNAPQWFWEGDAVVTETAFTPSGRGRIPNFNLLFRTNFQEGRVFGYHKQYLRSFKHNIPDHYVLGYHLVSYLRKETGDPYVWEKIARRSWNVPFLPFRFSRSIKAETGHNVTELFDKMATDLKQKWESQTSQLQLTDYERINPRPTEAYTDYLYPQEIGVGNWVAIRSGIGDIEQLVSLNGGAQRVAFTLGLENTSGMLSAQNQRVVWNEYRFDPRWQARTYSIIKGFDFVTDKGRDITSRTRYAAAALSPDGKLVATVETTTSYQTRLVIVDYETGAVVKTFDNEGNIFISMPRFTQDGSQIIALATTTAGRELFSFDMKSGATVSLANFEHENIGAPYPFGQYVLYSSPYSGIDNLYALDTKTGNRYKITESKYGAYHPVVSSDGNYIYYNDQSRNGMDVVRMPFKPAQWKPLAEVTVLQVTDNDHLVEQEGHPHLLDSVPSTTYSTRRYRRVSGIFNPHSWGPYVNTDLTGLNAGFISQDVLSTTTFSAGYGYDASERTGFWNAQISYQALYPIIDFRFTSGNRSDNEGNFQFSDGVKEVSFDWQERNVELGLRIPIITTHSKYISSVQFGNAIGSTQVTDFRNSINGGGRLIPPNPENPNNVLAFLEYADNGTLVYNRFSLTALRLLKQSRRDINSKWGQVLNVSSYSTPYGGDFSGTLHSAYAVLYFPGLFKHHSIWGWLGYQYNDVSFTVDRYFFRNTVPTPRGTSVARFRNFYTASANYTLPLWYPDIALGPVINFQRVRGNAFIDHARGRQTLGGFDRNYTSFGGELRFDVNIMRFLPQFNFGVRYAYDVDESATNIDFLIGAIGF